jgi:hypothetical protein
MRIAVSALACLMLAGCGGATSDDHENAVEQPAPVKESTASDVFKQFKTAGLPVADVKLVTESSDDNHLLGRPNQYISKVFFFDTRHPKADGEDSENTIEVFATEDDAKARHDYIQNVTKDVPMLLQYQLLNGKTLVRLSKAVLPSEVEGYKKAIGITK